MKKLTVIRNAQVVLEHGILFDGALILEDGKIAQIVKERELEIPVGAEVIDAGGDYVGPGFVDIHVHSGKGFDTYGQVKEAADYFLAHGATSIMSTPSYNMNFQEHMEAIELTKAAMPSVRTVRGMYLEGPYTNPRYGAFADRNPWRREIPEEEYKAMVDAAGAIAKVWTIAPERPDVMPFVEYARKVNPNVIFSLGHSEATPEQVRKMGKYTPKIMTHTFNATGRIPVSGGTRGYGPDEYCLQTPDMYAELISDSCGIHVNAMLQQMLIKVKGIEKVILITDGAGTDYPNPPHLAHVTDLNFTDKGGLAGSKLTMDQACKNIMASTNCGIAQAFLMGATNPARAVGLEELGVIEVGKNADLVFTNDKFQIHRVMVDGEICK